MKHVLYSTTQQRKCVVFEITAGVRIGSCIAYRSSGVRFWRTPCVHSSMTDHLAGCTQDAIQPTAVGACVVNASTEGRILCRCFVTSHNHVYYVRSSVNVVVISYADVSTSCSVKAKFHYTNLPEIKVRNLSPTYLTQVCDKSM